MGLLAISRHATQHVRQRGDCVIVVDAQGELGIVGRIYVLSKDPIAYTGVVIVMYINSLSRIGY